MTVTCPPSLLPLLLPILCLLLAAPATATPPESCPSPPVHAAPANPPPEPSFVESFGFGINRFTSHTCVSLSGDAEDDMEQATKRFCLFKNLCIDGAGEFVYFQDKRRRLSWDPKNDPATETAKEPLSKLGAVILSPPHVAPFSHGALRQLRPRFVRGPIPFVHVDGDGDGDGTGDIDGGGAAPGTPPMTTDPNSTATHATRYTRGEPGLTTFLGSHTHAPNFGHVIGDAVWPMVRGMQAFGWRGEGESQIIITNECSDAVCRRMLVCFLVC